MSLCVLVAQQKERCVFRLTQGLFGFLSTLRCMGLALPVPSLLTSNMLPFSPDLFTFATQVLTVCGGALLLTALAYAGTLYTDYLEHALPGQRYFQGPGTRMEALRNYVVVGRAH